MADPSRDEIPPLNILVVDDEPTSQSALSMSVEVLGHRGKAVSGVQEAVGAAVEDVYDLALVDLRLGADSGLDLIERLQEQSPWTKIVVITAHSTIASAVEAIRRGAIDYIEKPIAPSDLEAVARRISTFQRLERGIRQLRADLDSAVPPRVESRSRAMLNVLATARRAAESDATILIRGESGTGKGVLARAIHEWSARRERPFAVVNTPSLSRELLESELFGHVKGAFTGAVRSRQGRIAHCDGGTLFLDELGAMPAEMQPKLLRFLQDRTYERVGGDQTMTADIRTIVATNSDLEAAIAAGEFREDLYFRIRVIEITVPPLRERPEDLMALADGFVEFFGTRYGKPGASLTDAARRVIEERAWPGNIRELQNALERAVILSRGTQIGAGALPPADRNSRAEADGTPLISLDDAEKRHIEGVLRATESAKDAADVLGISTTTLWRRRQKHGI